MTFVSVIWGLPEPLKLWRNSHMTLSYVKGFARTYQALVQTLSVRRGVPITYEPPMTTLGSHEALAA